MNRISGTGVSLLFMILLFFALGISSLFVVLTGAHVYENINHRMEENFGGQIALSYISNKVRQSDEKGRVTVEKIAGTDVLVLEEEIDDTIYQTMIYCQDGHIKELYSEEGSGLSLADGIEIMDCDRLHLTRVSDNLLKVELESEAADLMYIALRSESGRGDE